MDSINYAKKLVAEFGVTLEDAIKAMDTEADDIRNDPFRGPSDRKPSLPGALATAYNHLKDWLSTGNEYVVKLEWEDLARFAFSHRKACVWAVMTAKAKAVKP